MARTDPIVRRRNFHLPLPDELYAELQAEAVRKREPLTHVVRRALEQHVEAERRAALHRAIAHYADAMAGTAADLDPELEAASIDRLLAEDDDS